MWIIFAIIAPVPVFHFWLHALLPFWRRAPLLFYAWCGIIWAAAFWFFFEINPRSPVLFSPNPWQANLGGALVWIGFAAAIFSVLSLGPIRFFMWAVLRPLVAPRVRLGGIYRALPHPAYFGYIVVALGALLQTGSLLSALVLALQLTLTPIMIYFEEEEMKKRLDN